MVTRILNYREWSRMEAYLALFLLAILVSEVAVILLLGQVSGKVLAQFIASLWSGLIRVLVRSWKWIYKMVGPIIFPLFFLNTAELWSIIKLIKLKKARHSCNGPAKYYKVLEIVEGSAPGFGFLGTCIALIFTMYGMDPNLTQTAMLQVLLDNSASAFGSTVYGISLAITAFISKEIFKSFLIKSERSEGKEIQYFKRSGEASSTKHIEKEV